MGQSVVKELSSELSNVKEFFKGAQQMAVLSYAEFINMVKELNRISEPVIDSNGRSLLFIVKGGSDTSIFWKATVQVGCIRIIRETKEMESFKLLNLKQFLQAYKIILYNIQPMIEAQYKSCSGECQSPSADSKLQRNILSTSMILNQISPGKLGEDTEECCICMERKPEITLPCAHSYCLFCIEQWKVTSQTCPVCREKLENTDESWVLPDIPESTEMYAELQKALSGIAEKFPEED